MRGGGIPYLLKFSDALLHMCKDMQEHYKKTFGATVENPKGIVAVDVSWLWANLVGKLPDDQLLAMFNVAEGDGTTAAEGEDPTAMDTGLDLEPDVAAAAATAAAAAKARAAAAAAAYPLSGIKASVASFCHSWLPFVQGMDLYVERSSSEVSYKDAAAADRAKKAAAAVASVRAALREGKKPERSHLRLAVQRHRSLFFSYDNIVEVVEGFDTTAEYRGKTQVIDTVENDQAMAYDGHMGRYTAAIMNDSDLITLARIAFSTISPELSKPVLFYFARSLHAGRVLDTGSFDNDERLFYARVQRQEFALQLKQNNYNDRKARKEATAATATASSAADVQSPQAKRRRVAAAAEAPRPPKDQHQCNLNKEAAGLRIYQGWRSAIVLERAFGRSGVGFFSYGALAGNDAGKINGVGRGKSIEMMGRAAAFLTWWHLDRSKEPCRQHMQAFMTKTWGEALGDSGDTPWSLSEDVYVQLSGLARALPFAFSAAEGGKLTGVEFANRAAHMVYLCLALRGDMRDAPPEEHVTKGLKLLAATVFAVVLVKPTFMAPATWGRFCEVSETAFTAPTANSAQYSWTVTSTVAGLHGITVAVMPLPTAGPRVHSRPNIIDITNVDRVALPTDLGLNRAASPGERFVTPNNLPGLIPDPTLFNIVWPTSLNLGAVAARVLRTHVFNVLRDIKNERLQDSYPHGGRSFNQAQDVFVHTDVSLSALRVELCKLLGGEAVLTAVLDVFAWSKEKLSGSQQRCVYMNLLNIITRIMASDPDSKLTETPITLPKPREYKKTTRPSWNLNEMSRTTTPTTDRLLAHVLRQNEAQTIIFEALTVTLANAVVAVVKDVTGVEATVIVGTGAHEPLVTKKAAAAQEQKRKADLVRHGELLRKKAAGEVIDEELEEHNDCAVDDDDDEEVGIDVDVVVEPVGGLRDGAKPEPVKRTPALPADKNVIKQPVAFYCGILLHTAALAALRTAKLCLDTDIPSNVGTDAKDFDVVLHFTDEQAQKLGLQGPAPTLRELIFRVAWDLGLVRGTPAAPLLRATAVDDKEPVELSRREKGPTGVPRVSQRRKLMPKKN
jgi:hypothetical protein